MAFLIAFWAFIGVWGAALAWKLWTVSEDIGQRRIVILMIAMYALFTYMVFG